MAAMRMVIGWFVGSLQRHRPSRKRLGYHHQLRRSDPFPCFNVRAVHRIKIAPMVLGYQVHPSSPCFGMGLPTERRYATPIASGNLEKETRDKLRQLLPFGSPEVLAVRPDREEDRTSWWWVDQDSNPRRSLRTQSLPSDNHRSPAPWHLCHPDRRSENHGRSQTSVSCRFV